MGYEEVPGMEGHERIRDKLRNSLLDLRHIDLPLRFRHKNTKSGEISNKKRGCSTSSPF